jgi:hypothetical protein
MVQSFCARNAISFSGCAVAEQFGGPEANVESRALKQQKREPGPAVNTRLQFEFPAKQEGGVVDNVAGASVLVPSVPPKIPIGPEIRCPHAEAGLNLRSYICRECAGVLRTRSFGPRGASYTVHRLHPLLAGNRKEDFATLRFQPHLMVRPDKGHNPHAYVNDNWRLNYEVQQSHFTEAGIAAEDGDSTETVCQSPGQEIGGYEYGDLQDFVLVEAVPRMSVLQIGIATWNGHLISIPPPNSVARPEHKCIHGVSWGADNCRVCCEITYAGKQARLIWQAIDTRKIRPNIGRSRRELFTLDGSGDPGAGFVLVRKSAIDRVLGVTDFIDPKELQRYRDIIVAATKNTCIECGAPIDPELNYCQGCARISVMNEVPEAGGEYIQTWGEDAAFSESKARPLSDRNIDFEIVRLVARTFICSVLSDATGEEIGTLSDEGFMELCQWSPPMMTLLRRFYLWTRNEPLADIAAVEGTTRKGIEQYFHRWTEKIENVISPLK